MIRFIGLDQNIVKIYDNDKDIKFLLQNVVDVALKADRGVRKAK